MENIPEEKSHPIYFLVEEEEVLTVHNMVFLKPDLPAEGRHK